MAYWFDALTIVLRRAATTVVVSPHKLLCSGGGLLAHPFLSVLSAVVKRLKRNADTKHSFRSVNAKFSPSLTMLLWKYL